MGSVIKPPPLPHVLRACALVLMLGVAACGEKPAAIPAGKFAAPEPAPPAVQPAPAAPAPAPPARAEVVQREANAALAARVKSALIADPEINALEIDVIAAQGAVTLYGTAPTRASRDKAARVAARIEGVKTVANKLAVVAGS